MNRFKLKPVVAVILKKDKNVLFLRRFKTGFMDGIYSLIYGHVDGGETIVQAGIREAKEEAGVIIKPEDCKVVHAVHIRQDKIAVETHNEAIVFFIEVDKWEKEPRNMEPHKHDDMQWFALDNPPENIMPSEKYLLERISQGIFYSEWGWD